MKIINYIIIAACSFGLLTLNGCATLVLNERIKDKYIDSERGLDASDVKTASNNYDFTAFYVNPWISKLNEDRIVLKGSSGKIDMFIDINLKGYQKSGRYDGTEIILTDKLKSLKIDEVSLLQSNLPKIPVTFVVNTPKIDLVDIKNGGCIYIQLYSDDINNRKGIREGKAIFIYNKVLISKNVLINISPDAYGYIALGALTSLCIITIPVDIILLPLQPFFLLAYGSKTYSH